MNQIIKKLPFLHKNSDYSQALELYEQGNFEKAIEGFNKVISQPKKAGVYYNLSLFYIKESYLHLGFAYEHMGMYEEAVENFTAAARIYPDYPDIHYHLGLCFCFLEEFDRAQQAFLRALEINPRHTAAISLLGFTCVRLHRLNDAVDYYQKALQINHLYADYHYMLGSIYGLSHRFDAAKHEFQQALEINPQYLDAKSGIMLIEENQRHEKDDSDKADLTQKLLDEFSGNFATVPVDTVKSYGQSGPSTEGEDIISRTILFYEKAVEINPNYADLHYHLGMYQAKKGNHRQAIEAFLRALKINSHYIQAMVNLALTYRKAGEMDNGIQILLKAAALHPHYPDLHYYLGTLYAEKGDVLNAVESFEKALSINPDYPECHAALAILHEKQGRKDQAALYWNLYLKNCPHPEWEEEIRRYLSTNFSETEVSG
jgi:tetratricopeptide (TPR) repeat protein